MRGLCGWFADRPEDAAAGALGRMLAAHAGPTADAGQQTVAQAGLAVFGSPARPQLVEVDGCLLAVAGHPRLRTGSGSTDPVELARVLQARGKAALTDIGGDFALAVWDTRRQAGLVAVDRIGVHQIVYGRANGTLAFGSTLDMVAGYPGIRRELSRQGIFDYLFYHVSPGPTTIFSGLMRLPAGHCIEFGPRGAGEASAYWSMSFDEQSGRSQEQLK